MFLLFSRKENLVFVGVVIELSDRFTYTSRMWDGFVSGSIFQGFNVYVIRKKIEDIPEERRHHLLSLLNPRFVYL